MWLNIGAGFIIIGVFISFIGLHELFDDKVDKRENGEFLSIDKDATVVHGKIPGFNYIDDDGVKTDVEVLIYKKKKKK